MAPATVLYCKTEQRAMVRAPVDAGCRRIQGAVATVATVVASTMCNGDDWLELAHQNNGEPLYSHVSEGRNWG
jgi:hypothetical protein